MPEIDSENYISKFIQYYNNQKFNNSTKKNAVLKFKGKAFDEILKRPCLCPTVTYIRKVSKFRILINLIFAIFSEIFQILHFLSIYYSLKMMKHYLENVKY